MVKSKNPNKEESNIEIEKESLNLIKYKEKNKLSLKQFKKEGQQNQISPNISQNSNLQIQINNLNYNEQISSIKMLNISRNNLITTNYIKSGYVFYK